MTVWKFDSVHGAESALGLLQRMQREELVTINDAAYVYWPEVVTVMPDRTVRPWITGLVGLFTDPTPGSPLRTSHR